MLLSLSWYSYIIIGWVMLILAGCSATSDTREVVLPGGKKIVVATHRTDVRMMDCATGAAIQTWVDGQLIDSKEFRGEALHCKVIPASIEAGGRVGAAAVYGKVAAKAASSASSYVTLGSTPNPTDPPPPSGSGNGNNGEGGHSGHTDNNDHGQGNH